MSELPLVFFLLLDLFLDQFFTFSRTIKPLVHVLHQIHTFVKTLACIVYYY